MKTSPKLLNIAACALAFAAALPSHAAPSSDGRVVHIGRDLVKTRVYR